MKAEELMIGDYVQWKNRYVRVASVSGIVYSFGQQDVVLHGCNDDKLLEKHLTKDISPIPLTVELLKVNGFEQDPETGECLLSDHDDTFEVVWLGTILTVQSGYGRMELVDCQYVHELQQALRMCKISKEITL